MSDEETNVLGHICDIRDALDGIAEGEWMITPEHKTRLSRVHIRFGDLLTELMERKHGI